MNMTQSRKFELTELLSPIIAATDKRDMPMIAEALDEFKDTYYFVDFSEDDWEFITPILNDAKDLLLQQKQQP